MRRPVFHMFFGRDERSIVGDSSCGKECRGSGGQRTKSWSNRPGTREGNSIHVPTIAPFPKTDLAHNRAWDVIVLIGNGYYV